MFCMRVARSGFPDDPSGYRFIPLCEGTSSDVPDDIRNHDGGDKFASLIERRPQTMAALDQVLGDLKVDDSASFAKDELQSWLKLLLPFYGTDDPTGDNVLPRSTEALAAVMTQLIDAKNQDVLDTIARISQRTGYRAPDRVLAAIRPSLTYANIDALTTSLLDLVKDGGAGHDAFMGVLEAAALELAQEADPKQTPSTLDLAYQLVLQSGVDASGTDVNDLFVKAEPGKLDYLPVLSRDDQGNAIPTPGASVDAPPFRVAGRDDSADYDPDTHLAMSGGQPAYQVFDANTTALASLMRDSVSLIQRGNQPRSTVEKLLRMSRPLLGGSTMRTESFGASKSLTFQGTDVEHGPMANFLWSLTTLLKLPETKPLLQVLDKLIATNEPAATELIYAALQIHAESKKPDYDNAKLGGGQPHEFWDDLIKFGQDLIANRPGALLDVLNATIDDKGLTAAQGAILAHQMQFADQVKQASADVNSEVTSGCPTTDPPAAYCVPVDRTMPDTLMNRSIFQRTLSVIHATYNAQNCNKDGATLTVQKPVPTTFPNPPLGPLAPFLGVFGGGSGSCPNSTVAPPPATSYKACTLIEQKNAAVTQMRAMLGLGKVAIKDSEVTDCAKAVGTDAAKAQEEESGITGFTLTPTAKAIARFTYGPRNKFLTDMFDPVQTVDSKAGNLVNLVDYEPNGIWPLEIVDPDGKGTDGNGNSFLSAVGPLLGAFDKHDTIDDNGDPAGDGKYYFAELLNLVHMHYSSPKPDLCAVPFDKSAPGCVQSADPTQPFYVHGTNLVSYEPLIIYSLTQQDLLGVLRRSTQALKAIALDDGRDGVAVLEAFIEAVLKPNPDLKYKDGRTYAKTNLCSEMTGPDGMPACAPDANGNAVGRIVQGGVPALYLMLDALNDLDAMWGKNSDDHDLYLDVRSTLTDKLLDVTKSTTDGTTAFSNRRAYALTRRAVPWLLARLDDHQADLGTWADGLVDRLAGVLGHPLAARGMDLFDAFWENEDAGNQVAALLAYLFDDKGNPEAFTGAVIAAADTLTFVDKDDDITPAVRFAALLLADNAIDVINGSGDDLDISEGTAYRFLEVTRKIGVVDADQKPLTTLAKLLKNIVLPMADPQQANLDGKSPLEEFIDVVADVNRVDPTQPSSLTLDADDDRQVFDMIRQFLTDQDVGLERLYAVIENRDIK